MPECVPLVGDTSRLARPGQREAIIMGENCGLSGAIWREPLQSVLRQVNLAYTSFQNFGGNCWMRSYVRSYNCTLSNITTENR